jgi:hypothetical protein
LTVVIIRYFGYFLILISISTHYYLFPQAIKTETGEFSIRVESDKSELETQNKGIEQARINAIKKAFGEKMLQGNNTWIENYQGKEKVESQTMVSLTSETYVNGEWLEDVKEPKIEKEFKDGALWLKITVVCKVRELTNQTNQPFSYFTSSCPDLKCKTSFFNDGQDFYLFFKSPVNGFLAAYLEVPKEGKTYRLLPYQSQASQGSFAIQADKEYFFFSPEHGSKEFKSFIDEISVTLYDKSVPESNTLIVIFSEKNQFGKPSLENTRNHSGKGTHSDEGIILPASIGITEFNKWYINLRQQVKDLQVDRFIFTINPLK